MQSVELERSRDTTNTVELAAVALLDPIANRASPFGATCNVKRYTENSYSSHNPNADLALLLKISQQNIKRRCNYSTGSRLNRYNSHVGEKWLSVDGKTISNQGI